MEQVKKNKSFFGRTGGKHFSKKTILPFIKDLEYKTYCEPFVGAGSIFLGREKKAEVEVINDFDPLVINLWEGMKECGSELKDYSLYFQDKSVFKWYLLKEKQNRRMRKKQQELKDIETLKEDLFITRCSRAQDNINVDQTKSSSNSCSCSKTIWNRKIETLKEDLFITKNGRFSDNDVSCSIEKTDKGLKLVKKKYYVRNKKFKGNETKWRLHNPNLCGWNNILNNCNKYQERLKDTIIHQGDYKKMIELYDSEETLFYFDPPWTKTSSGKKGNKCYSGFVELQDFYNSIKDIKGKWFCSYNNDDEILETFKGHKIEYINTIYTTKKAGNKKTIDILIFSKNF